MVSASGTSFVGARTCRAINAVLSRQVENYTHQGGQGVGATPVAALAEPGRSHRDAETLSPGLPNSSLVRSPARDGVPEPEPSSPWATMRSAFVASSRRTQQTSRFGNVLSETIPRSRRGQSASGPRTGAHSSTTGSRRRRSTGKEGLIRLHRRDCRPVPTFAGVRSATSLKYTFAATAQTAPAGDADH